MSPSRLPPLSVPQTLHHRRRPVTPGSCRDADSRCLLVRASVAGAPVACSTCLDSPPATAGARCPRTVMMEEGQANAVKASLGPRVKANLVLGAESFAISSESGILSEQLAAMKEKGMVILKEYITKHNAPNDVPEEPIVGESDGEGEALVNKPPKKLKKQK